MEPLICKPDDIIDIFRQGMEMDAPISELIIEYNELLLHFVFL